MWRMSRRLALLAGALLLKPVATGHAQPFAAAGADAVDTVRFATFNVSLYGSRTGEVAERLADPAWEKARLAAATIQEVRPDVLLVNEIDWDADGETVRRFVRNFLAVGQGGREPLDYPYVYVPEVNTGVQSGHDLDRDGAVTGTPGARAYGNDAFGFGVYPGQYGLAVLSRFPIDVERIRTFRLLRWKDVPGNLLPEGWYTAAAREVLRLSSKTHADVPIVIDGTTVHLLASHPTPPGFDGPEDRNGRRNHDEIRFWESYVGDARAEWIVDDVGRRGALGAQPFVIAGDLNADPNDGNSTGGAIQRLLAHPRVQGAFAPRSAGGAEQSRLQGRINGEHRGDPAADTADFNDGGPGNLRVDYVVPSVDLPIVGGGVFWPRSAEPLFGLVGTHPFPVSDHRLVWVDVRIGTPRRPRAPGIAPGRASRLDGDSHRGERR
ncbi:MAG: endonuclease/exonuclease/phosphatase family protein [Pseudomonadota bacterium]